MNVYHDASKAVDERRTQRNEDYARKVVMVCIHLHSDLYIELAVQTTLKFCLPVSVFSEYLRSYISMPESY